MCSHFIFLHFFILPFVRSFSNCFTPHGVTWRLCVRIWFMGWNDSGAFICGWSVWSIPLTCPRLPVTPVCLDEVNTSFYRAADWQSLMAGFGRYKKLVQLNWLTVCGIPFVLVMMAAGWGRTLEMASSSCWFAVSLQYGERSRADSKFRLGGDERQFKRTFQLRS